MTEKAPKICGFPKNLPDPYVLICELEGCSGNISFLNQKNLLECLVAYAGCRDTIIQLREMNATIESLTEQMKDTMREMGLPRFIL